MWRLFEVFLTPVRSSSRSDQQRNPRPSRLSHSPMLKRYSIQMKLTQFNFSLKHSSNDYPSDDMLGIGDVETSPSPVVNRNVSVNTTDCTADGMVVGETTETNAPSDPC
ncbi:BnaC01g31790D [Brassica napus]|uniref:BnaC01g31790D protein n=1 Tax=Brassica napus TaxID=3708 RepID=A0A078G1V8_BRANA|nr:BnaC01g31790D [Brassica napus]